MLIVAGGAEGQGWGSKSMHCGGLLAPAGALLIRMTSSLLGSSAAAAAAVRLLGLGGVPTGVPPRGGVRGAAVGNAMGVGTAAGALGTAAEA